MRGELAPALAEVAQQARARGARLLGGAADARDQQRARCEGRGVDAERDARARERGDEAARRGAEAERGRLRDREPGVRRLEPIARHDERNQADRRREVQRERDAGDGVQRDDDREARAAGEQQRGDRALRARRQEIGAHHLAAARAAVGERAGEELHRHLRARADRDHEADVARRAAQIFEHGEGQRDRRHRAAERGDEARGEEPREGGLAQQSQTLAPARCRHGPESRRSRGPRSQRRG